MSDRGGVRPVVLWRLHCPRSGCLGSPELYASEGEAVSDARVHARHHAEDDAREVAELEAMFGLVGVQRQEQP